MLANLDDQRLENLFAGIFDLVNRNVRRVKSEVAVEGEHRDRTTANYPAALDLETLKTPPQQVIRRFEIADVNPHQEKGTTGNLDSFDAHHWHGIGIDLN